MLAEVIEALAADRGLDSWTVYETPWGRSKVVVLIDEPPNPKARVKAQAWLEERANGIHLMYRIGNRGPAGSKILKDGWDQSVAEAVALGLVAAASLPDEDVIRIMQEKYLTPEGRVPKDRCVRRIVNGLIADVRRGKPRARIGSHAEVVKVLSAQFDEMPGRKADKAMRRARTSLRGLMDLGVPFQAVKDLWDEETVRSVQES